MVCLAPRASARRELPPGTTLTPLAAPGDDKIPPPDNKSFRLPILFAVADGPPIKECRQRLANVCTVCTFGLVGLVGDPSINPLRETAGKTVYSGANQGLRRMYA